jgi:hypothetical protein
MVQGFRLEDGPHQNLLRKIPSKCCTAAITIVGDGASQNNGAGVQKLKFYKGRVSEDTASKKLDRAELAALRQRDICIASLIGCKPNIIPLAPKTRSVGYPYISISISISNTKFSNRDATFRVILVCGIRISIRKAGEEEMPSKPLK